MLFGSAVALWFALFLVLPAELPFQSDVNSYVGGAAALSAGHGYRFEPYINLPPVRTYPPGYASWLALFWKNGQPISVNSYRLEIGNWLAAGGVLAGLAGCLFISELSSWFGCTLLISFGTSVVFTQLMFWLMSDVLFTAGTCGLVLLVATYDSRESGRRLSVWWLCAGLLIGVLCVLKAATLGLAAGLGAYGLWKGDLRRLWRLVYFVVPPALTTLWFFHTGAVPSYAPSSSHFWSLYALRSTVVDILYGTQRWLVTMFLNVPDRLPQAHFLQHGAGPAEVLIFILGLAVFAVPIFLGVRKNPREDKDRIALFILGAYALELMLWSQYDGARLPMPIIPFLLTFLWRGLPSKAARIAFLTVLAVNIPGNAWLSYKSLRSEEKESVQSLAELRNAAYWINATGGATALVAAGRDVPISHLYEYLGRRMLANAGPSELGIDVDPAAQNNMRAGYIVTSASSPAPSRHYHIDRRFGHWNVLARNES